MLLFSCYLQMLNQIVCEFPPEHPLASVRPLRDSLGHTPFQVGCTLRTISCTQIVVHCNICIDRKMTLFCSCHILEKRRSNSLEFLITCTTVIFLWKWCKDILLTLWSYIVHSTMVRYEIIIWMDKRCPAKLKQIPGVSLINAKWD